MRRLAALLAGCSAHGGSGSDTVGVSTPGGKEVCRARRRSTPTATPSEAECPTTFDDFLHCYASSTLACDDNLPSVPGCDAEANAFAACGATM
jgi:hypothetical protein